MAAGVYRAQSIAADPSKLSASANVVFRPAGGTVTLANSVLLITGSHVELHGISMDQTGCVSTQIAPPCPSVVVQNVAHDVLLDGIHASRFYITGAYNVTVQNSDFGPSYDFHGIIHADTAGNRPHDILLSNVTIHDHWNSAACKALASCLAAHHQGCGPTLNDAYNVVEDRVHWFNCDDLDQLIKPYKFANQNVTIQNSVFGPNNGYYSLDLTSTASMPNQAIRLLNNTFSKGISVTKGIPYPNSQMIGNIVPLSTLSCSLFAAGGWTVSSNSTC